jgi:hypothetical protein
MNYFDSFDELWLYAANQLIEDGEIYAGEYGNVKEFLGFGARVNLATKSFLYNPVRMIDPSLAAGSVLCNLDSSLFNVFGLYDDKFIFMIHGLEQKYLKEVSENIRTSNRIDVELRQNASSIHILLMRKNDILNMILTINKTDIWYHLPYIVFILGSVQRLIASFAGVEVGWMQIAVSNLVISESMIERLKEAANPPSFNVAELESSDMGNVFYIIPKALGFESYARETGNMPFNYITNLRYNLLGHLAIMAGMKWSERKDLVADKVEDKYMSQYLRLFYQV